MFNVIVQNFDAIFTTAVVVVGIVAPAAAVQMRKYRSTVKGLVRVIHEGRESNASALKRAEAAGEKHAARELSKIV